MTRFSSARLPAQMPPDVLNRIRAAGLQPDYVVETVRMALDEDLGGGVDVTSFAVVAAEERAVADVVTRAAGVVAGLPVAAATFVEATEGDAVVEFVATDGARVAAGARLLTVHGPARGLLTAERTALNFLGHLSGIATATARWVDAVAGTGAEIRDTRKTTPGLRALEKYAVRCGGGRNHRMSLSDAALIKDNHIVAAGSITEAFARVKATFPNVPLEVECDTLEQVEEAVRAGASLILVDNMSLEQMRAAVDLVGQIAPGRCKVEASGGLSLENARAVAQTGVHYLAVGSLTHSAAVLDIGVDFRPSSVD
ncbi:MAG: carboxylating nicotinate-nucleotide diphosphorylase [Acidothermus sp.]|nr:carboxylating nicotinate-nucleotide diphosphorylase [Acidothermus sp.]MCL6537702.1 carboxylating nicotinate-nucleotide diphosphorylase [Acidothermus sp.]